MGVAQALRATCPRVKVHPLEPAESPTLSTGHKVGRHRIQGVSDEFIPSICKISSLDDVIAVHDGDAILMAQRLAQELGLGVGISSGANLLGPYNCSSDMVGAALWQRFFVMTTKIFIHRFVTARARALRVSQHASGACQL